MKDVGLSCRRIQFCRCLNLNEKDGTVHNMGFGGKATYKLLEWGQKSRSENVEWNFSDDKTEKDQKIFI